MWHNSMAQISQKMLFIPVWLTLLKVKGLLSEKVQAKGSYSLQHKTLLLHCLKQLDCHQAFTYITCVHHYVTGII